ncbi:tail fiber domain-containing protein, partial [Candidatus Zixiibacteriota bacterium]
IGGGSSNEADAGGTVAGGYYNNAIGIRSTVGGGELNTASGSYSTVAGGGSNQVLGDHSVILGGYSNNISATADYSYLFGIDGNLDEDSTFMVDMPHIRFGNEVDGYEFPASDGTADQIMQTDGSGRVDWVDIPISDDGDWTLVDHVLFTGGEYGIARAGNVLFGDYDSTHVNLGVACTTGLSGQNRACATVSGGVGNTASGWKSTVGGGEGNSASGYSHAVVGGGFQNTASDYYATVGGGQLNTASGVSATVGGGDTNTARGWSSTVSGGNENTASGSRSTVSGGSENTASGGYFPTIGGGSENTASGGYGATIAGGSNNTASDNYATVGGGRNNKARGRFSTIGGGGGPDSGPATSDSNSALGYLSAILGGRGNIAEGDKSCIGGGTRNTASGANSVVPGGHENEAAGTYSFAAGLRAKANHGGAFVWGDSTEADFSSTGTNQFLIRASGGVGIGTDSPSYKLDVVGSGDFNQSIYSRATDAGTTRFGLSNSVRHWTISNFNDGVFAIADETAAALRLVIDLTGKVGIGRSPTANALEVEGNASKTTAGSWLANSDMRIKTDVQPLSDALTIIEQLRPVQFMYTEDYRANTCNDRPKSCHGRLDWPVTYLAVVQPNAENYHCFAYG